jgi:prevent-host-death family protein
MSGTPNIISISDLRHDAAGVVERVTASREPAFITRRGRAAAVMVSMETYELMQKELEILLLFARGEKEIEAGIGHDLDAVLADLDKI